MYIFYTVKIEYNLSKYKKMSLPNSLISMLDCSGGVKSTSYCNKLVADLNEYGRDWMEMSYDDYGDFEVSISYNSRVINLMNFGKMLYVKFKKMSNSKQLINMFKDMEIST